MSHSLPSELKKKKKLLNNCCEYSDRLIVVMAYATSRYLLGIVRALAYTIRIMWTKNQLSPRTERTRRKELVVCLPHHVKMLKPFAFVVLGEKMPAATRLK